MPWREFGAGCTGRERASNPTRTSRVRPASGPRNARRKSFAASPPGRPAKSRRKRAGALSCSTGRRRHLPVPGFGRPRLPSLPGLGLARCRSLGGKAAADTDSSAAPPKWSLFGAMAPPRTLLPSSTPAGASSSPSNFIQQHHQKSAAAPRQLGLKSKKSEILKRSMPQKEMIERLVLLLRDDDEGGLSLILPGPSAAPLSQQAAH